MENNIYSENLPEKLDRGTLLSADSVRVVKPIRLSHLHKYKSTHDCYKGFVHSKPDKFENGVFVAPKGRIKCSPSTLSFSNCFSVHTETLVRRDCDRDIMALNWSRQRFQKVPFSPSTLTHLAGVFKSVHFVERFQKVRFSVSATPFQCGRKAYPKKKVAFSNLFCLVWT